MRTDLVLTILAKELRETLRDRRTLTLMIGLPVLLYPLMIIGFTRLQESQTEAVEARTSRVAVWGTLPGGPGALFGEADHVEAAAWLGAPEEVRREIEAGRAAPAPVEAGAPSPRRPRGRRQDLAGVQAEAPNPVLAAARQSVTGRQADAVLVVWPGFEPATAEGGIGTVTIYFDSVRDDSRRARQRVAEALDAYREALIAGRERARGLPEGFSAGLDVRTRDVAPPARQTGYVLGTFLPFLLISLSLFGGFYAAVDLTAGEKERGTMQTLLCAPLRPIEIVAAKATAVWIISLITALANLASVGATVARVMPSGGLHVAPGTLALAAVMLLPITLTTSALFVAVAVFARDFKDGQNFLTPVYMLVVVPAGITMLPGIELDAWTAFVPIVNIAMLLKSLLVAEARPDLVFLTLLSSTVYAVLAILFAVRVFQREQVLLGGRESIRTVFGLERRPGGLPTPTVALVAFAAALVVGFYASLLLEKRGLVTTILVTQYAFFLLPALAVVLGLGYDARRTLSLRLPPPRAILASVLFGVSAWIVVSGVVLRILPPPDSLVRALGRMLLLGDAEQPLWVIWLVLAVTPAVCEETFFRGLMLGGLRSLGKWPAIVVSALAFGLAHASIYRLVPMLVIGMVIGYSVWKSRSILCGMIVHVLNNGLLATLTRDPALAASLGIEGASLSLPTVAVGTLLLALGLWLLARLPELPPERGVRGRGTASGPDTLAPRR